MLAKSQNKTFGSDSTCKLPTWNKSPYCISIPDKVSKDIYILGTTGDEGCRSHWHDQQSVKHSVSLLGGSDTGKCFLQHIKIVFFLFFLGLNNNEELIVVKGS